VNFAQFYTPYMGALRRPQFLGEILQGSIAFPDKRRNRRLNVFGSARHARRGNLCSE
jgi:hypothetical protein